MKNFRLNILAAVVIMAASGAVQAQTTLAANPPNSAACYFTASGAIRLGAAGVSLTPDGSGGGYRYTNSSDPPLALGPGATAIGYGSTSIGENSIAAGPGSITTDPYSLAIGGCAAALGNGAYALGSDLPPESVPVDLRNPLG